MSPIDSIPSRFEWDDIRYFLEVARAGGLLEAGARLGVSHTTVARRIRSLEEDLSIELFEKKPTGYELTETGKYLLGYAQKVESWCLRLQEAVPEEHTGARSTVRIGVPEGFGCHVLPRHLDRFFLEQPDVDLEVLAQPDSLSVSKREAHVSITLDRPTAGRLIARVLTNYALHFYASVEYLQDHPPIRALDDLKRHHLIVTRHAIDSPNMRASDSIFPTFDARLRYRSINAQLAAVETGLGISLIPCYMADHRRSLRKVLPEEVRVERTYWICMHEDMRNVHRVRAVWEWLIAIVEKDQALILGI